MTKSEKMLECVKKFEGGDHAAIGECLHEDFFYEDSFLCRSNREEFLGLLGLVKEAFPDLSPELKIISEGEDTVRATMAPVGTHTGVLSYPGITPVKPTRQIIALPRNPVTFIFKGDKIIRIQVDYASGGGMKGILEHLGIELPERENA